MHPVGAARGARRGLGLLGAGVLLLVVGFTLGTAGADPLSAWVGTLGLVITATALVLLLARQVRGRRRRLPD